MRIQTLDESLEPGYSFMKIFNCGQKVLVHKHEGHIQSRIVYYLMNLHVVPRTIYLSRHGQSEYNAERRLGGDSPLTQVVLHRVPSDFRTLHFTVQVGLQYASRLAEHINSLEIPELVVWTSWLNRTVQTAQHITGHQVLQSKLNLELYRSPGAVADTERDRRGRLRRPELRRGDH